MKTLEALQYSRPEFDYTASTFNMQWAERFVLRNKSFYFTYGSLFLFNLFAYRKFPLFYRNIVVLLSLLLNLAECRVWKVLPAFVCN